MRTPRNPHFLTLGQAAEVTGKSKSYLSKAIKTGKISIVSKDDSGYQIDPSELFRVFPKATVVNSSQERLDTPNETPVLRAENEGLQKQIVLLERERNNLQQRLEEETEERRKLTLMLVDSRPRKNLLQRMFG